MAARKVNRGERTDAFTRQLPAQDKTRPQFGSPKSQQGVTVRASDLVAVTTEIKSDVMTEPEFREFVSSLERFVVAAAEGALRGEGEGDEGAKGAAPKYEGALRVAVDADVLGDKWSVAAGPSDLLFTVRVSVRVASKVAGASAGDSVEDAADWQSREAGARKLKSAKGVAREAKPWHLSRPLGEVRAGCQLELVRFVVGGFCSAYGLSVNASGEIFVADFNFNMW